MSMLLSFTVNNLLKRVHRSRLSALSHNFSNRCSSPEGKDGGKLKIIPLSVILGLSQFWKEDVGLEVRFCPLVVRRWLMTMFAIARLHGPGRTHFHHALSICSLGKHTTG